MKNDNPHNITLSKEESFHLFLGFLSKIVAILIPILPVIKKESSGGGGVLKQE